MYCLKLLSIDYIYFKFFKDMFCYRELDMCELNGFFNFIFI